MSRRPIIVGLLISLVAIAVPTIRVLAPADDPWNEPDAIVVLGGVGQERADLGIDLARRADLPLVLSSSATHFAAKRGYRCSLGNAECFPWPPAENTAEEARYTQAFAAQQGWTQVTVVTSSHHTTRARALFRQCLGDRVSIVGAPRSEGPTFSELAREVVGLVAAVTFRRAC
jgi:uncharacterized SAM-binding protein YcdF (DUF218 family)